MDKGFAWGEKRLNVACDADNVDDLCDVPSGIQGRSVDGAIRKKYTCLHNLEFAKFCKLDLGSRFIMSTS